MSDDPYSEIAKALARQRAAERRHVDLNFAALDGSKSCANLSVDDLAVVIADVIKGSEKRVIRHVGRMLTLVDAKHLIEQQKHRIDKLINRLAKTESEIRLMKRSKQWA